VSASLETWGQNLDLTIPSLEMQSTSVLDLRDKQEIMMGLTCCWDKKHIDSVQTEYSLESTLLQLKENQNQSWFTLSERPTGLQWTTFITLQLADIYTTYRGLKYDCVKELNPFLGESPSVPRIFAVKTAVLVPAIEADIKNERISPQVFNEMNFLMSMVIASNLDALRYAKESCRKL
jgi:hypothetical protein